MTFSPPLPPDSGLAGSGLPEFRTDVLTGLRVLVAPARSLRPSAIHPEPRLSQSHDPFAEGNETETPGEKFAVRAEGSTANSPGWSLRVVPNRYPAVMSPGDFPRSTSIETVERSGGSGCATSFGVSSSGESQFTVSGQADSGSGGFADAEGNEFFPSMQAAGEHDVVIECPDSRSQLLELSAAEIFSVLSAWRMRTRQLSAGGFVSLAIFRNEGFSAGASLAHCHSQIIAVKQPTPLDKIRSELAQNYRQRTGREMIADLLDAERSARVRLIEETPHFAVLCPFASRTAWHVRMIPTSIQSRSFADASDECLKDLARVLRDVLHRLQRILGERFSFNLTLPHPRLDEPPQFRWMLDLLPRTGRLAGWEYLSAVDIITVSPEAAAESLRRTDS